jgi:rRNA maturation endonuclease Nob1
VIADQVAEREYRARCRGCGKIFVFDASKPDARFVDARPAYYVVKCPACGDEVMRVA